jgi:hypothetical protein
MLGGFCIELLDALLVGSGKLIEVLRSLLLLLVALIMKVYS